jgi:hypothetical protein
MGRCNRVWIKWHWRSHDPGHCGGGSARISNVPTDRETTIMSTTSDLLTSTGRGLHKSRSSLPLLPCLNAASATSRMPLKAP